MSIPEVWQTGVSANLSSLGGRRARLKFASGTFGNGPRRTLMVEVSHGELGAGGEAWVFTVWPRGKWSTADYRDLGISANAPLVGRFSTDVASSGTRRVRALQSIVARQKSDPESLAGMVRIFGFGVVDQVDGEAVEDMTIYFDLMEYAGKSLASLVPVRDPIGGAEPGKRWNLRPAETAAAFLPAARALDTLHCITEGSAATAHRDIKPSNLLVLWPEEVAYGRIADRLGPAALPRHGLPLIRIGDLGTVRSEGTHPGATRTGTAPWSEFWSAPDTVRDGVGKVDPAADVWSFAATLFSRPQEPSRGKSFRCMFRLTWCGSSPSRVKLPIRLLSVSFRMRWRD
jgi:serine/threonine protein kinase